MGTRTSEPDILWHYTDAPGLFGIVDSCRFRFGDAGFLNDRTERVYGKELIDKVFTEEIAAGDEDGLLGDLWKHVRLTLSPDRLFVCSFSATKESISQWQRYGAGGVGYCLGFDAKRLDELFDSDAIHRVPMLYDEADQKEHLREKIRRGVEGYRQKAKSADPGDKNQGINVYDAIFTAADVASVTLRLKNPFFGDEQEWRYFHLIGEDELGDDDDSKEEFAIRGDYVKPFICFPQERKRKSLVRLPITGVVCGPRLDVDVAKPTVERFLRSRGYSGITAERSALAAIWR
jgi:hypothetical protein